MRLGYIACHGDADYKREKKICAVTCKVAIQSEIVKKLQHSYTW